MRFAEIEDKLARVTVSHKDVQGLLEKTAHDMEVAEDNREKAPDWTLKIVYEAILSGCTALMAAHGYRAKVNGHHYVTIRFAQLALPDHTALLDRAEMLRRRRHGITYGSSYTVSDQEVEDALSLARDLLPVLERAAREVLESGKGESDRSR